MAAFTAPRIETKNYVFASTHEEMNPRKRNTMEDVHRVIPSLKGSPEYSYFGVYDGHGGRQIADFLEENLENNISKELQQPDEAGILERLQRAYLLTDIQSSRLKIDTSGATAVSALLVTKFDEEDPSKVVSKMVYTANVGDSRCVVMSNHDPATGKSTEGGRLLAERLTYDHRAEDEGEGQRIRQAGGFIARQRVLGILAVTRAFGDHGMKEFVTAEPFCMEVDLSLRQVCPLLVLACDGVWDVFTDQEACDFLMAECTKRFHGESSSREKGSEGMAVEVQPFEGIAQLLVEAAIERGSADNVTAMVIFL